MRHAKLTSPSSIQISLTDIGQFDDAASARTLAADDETLFATAKKARENGFAIRANFAAHGKMAASYHGKAFSDVEGIIAIASGDDEIVVIRHRDRVQVRARQTMLPKIGAFRIARWLQQRGEGRLDREAAIAELAAWPALAAEAGANAHGISATVKYVASQIADHLVHVAANSRTTKERLSAKERLSNLVGEIDMQALQAKALQANLSSREMLVVHQKIGDSIAPIAEAALEKLAGAAKEADAEFAERKRRAALRRAERKAKDLAYKNGEEIRLSLHLDAAAFAPIWAEMQATGDPYGLAKDVFFGPLRPPREGTNAEYVDQFVRAMRTVAQGMAKRTGSGGDA